MSRKQSKQRSLPMKLFSKLVAFLVIVLANLCEVFAVAWVAEPAATCPGKACFAHFLSAVLVTLAFALFRVEYKIDEISPVKDDSEEIVERVESYANPMLVPAFFIAFFIPMFGTLAISLLGLVCRPKKLCESPIFNDYIDYVKNIDDDVPRFDKASEEQIILKLLEVEPVVDTINSKSKTAVWGSIDNLSQRTDSRAVSLIRESIRQNDAEVKFLASIGLEKMEESFQQRIVAAEKTLKSEPSADNLKNYLKQALLYLRSGLSDLSLNRSLLQKLASRYDQYGKDFQDKELKMLRAQILFLAGDKSGSGELVEKLMTEKSVSGEMILPAAEILFANGRLSEVRSLLAELTEADYAIMGLENQGVEVDLDELREFWAPGEIV